MDFLKLIKILGPVCLFLAFPFRIQAQIEKVIVETYYVSDANDATDTTGGILMSGSKTYRVFIDLLPGYRLKKIYGDANHPLKFSSSRPFFNNKEDGQTFAKDFSKNRYRNNTVALDTWITLGQVTKVSGSTYFGIPKKDDTDGSFVGGTNNDGGSSLIALGLLTNNDPAAGQPLTVADGISAMPSLPSNWAHYGFVDVISNSDSTIFGSIRLDSQFVGYNVALQNSGVMGVMPDSNQVLVAQLTTAGEISFELNIEVIDSNGTSYKLVANGDTLLEDEKVNPNLKYPPSCGCINPDYLEFNQNYACGVTDSCKTLIVFGCTDSAACNYNSGANFSIPSLCCYPGACAGLDINLLCPQLGVDDINQPEALSIFPTPASDQLFIESAMSISHETKYFVYDSWGRACMQGSLDALPLDISKLEAGVYILQLASGDSSTKKMFIKN